MTSARRVLWRLLRGRCIECGAVALDRTIVTAGRVIDPLPGALVPRAPAGEGAPVKLTAFIKEGA